MAAADHHVQRGLTFQIWPVWIGAQLQQESRDLLSAEETRGEQECLLSHVEDEVWVCAMNGEVLQEYDAKERKLLVEAPHEKVLDSIHAIHLCMTCLYLCACA